MPVLGEFLPRLERLRLLRRARGEGQRADRDQRHAQRRADQDLPACGQLVFFLFLFFPWNALVSLERLIPALGVLIVPIAHMIPVPFISQQA